MLATAWLNIRRTLSYVLSLPRSSRLGRKKVRSSLAGLTILMPPCKPMCGAWKKPTSAAHLYAPWCTVALASETRDLRICQLSHCEEPCTLLKPLRIYSLNVYNNSVFGLLIIINKYYFVFILTIFPFLRLTCSAANNVVTSQTKRASVLSNGQKFTISSLTWPSSGLSKERKIRNDMRHCWDRVTVVSRCHRRTFVVQRAMTSENSVALFPFLFLRGREKIQL